jgi:hypothetical protein
MGRQALHASRVLSRVRPDRSTNRQLLLHSVRRGHLVSGTSAVDGRAARRPGRGGAALRKKPGVLQQIRPVSLSKPVYAATNTAKSSWPPAPGRPIRVAGRSPRTGRLARRRSADGWHLGESERGTRTTNTDFTDFADFTDSNRMKNTCSCCGICDICGICEICVRRSLLRVDRVSRDRSAPGTPRVEWRPDGVTQPTVSPKRN